MNLKFMVPMALFSCLMLQGGAQNFILYAGLSSGDGSILSGDWQGGSICQVKPSACHDEEALYHIRHSGKKADGYSMQMDKIVQGKPEMMGTVECSFHNSNHQLKCVFPKGYLELVLQGDQLVGSMKLTDGTLWRKINLKKIPTGKKRSE